MLRQGDIGMTLDPGARPQLGGQEVSGRGRLRGNHTHGGPGHVSGGSRGNVSRAEGGVVPRVRVCVHGAVACAGVAGAALVPGHHEPRGWGQPGKSELRVRVRDTYLARGTCLRCHCALHQEISVHWHGAGPHSSELIITSRSYLGLSTRRAFSRSRSDAFCHSGLMLCVCLLESLSNQIIFIIDCLPAGAEFPVPVPGPGSLHDLPVTDMTTLTTLTTRVSSFWRLLLLFSPIPPWAKF